MAFNLDKPDALSETVQVAQPKSGTTWEELRKQYPHLPEQIPRPTRSVEPNFMSYTDGEGNKRDIWLPQGTSSTATQHYARKDWAALARFPTWNNQQYADEEGEKKERKEWEWLVLKEWSDKKDEDIKSTEEVLEGSSKL